MYCINCEQRFIRYEKQVKKHTEKLTEASVLGEHGAEE